MSGAVYELRREKVTLCTSRVPFLGYSPEVLRDMERVGLHLYKDGKREKPPRSCQTGSGKQNESTGIVPEKKGKVK